MHLLKLDFLESFYVPLFKPLDCAYAYCCIM